MGDEMRIALIWKGLPSLVYIVCSYYSITQSSISNPYPLPSSKPLPDLVGVPHIQLHYTPLLRRLTNYYSRDDLGSDEVGETLKKHAREEDGECCIITSPGEATWNVLMISFISLLVIAIFLATLLCTRIYWRNRQSSSRLVGENLVELLPCLTFSAAQISGYMGESCAICLESYQDGESLKLLACQHKFHANCVGSWLTNWNTCCPVCKYDLKTELHNLRFNLAQSLISQNKLTYKD